MASSLRGTDENEVHYLEISLRIICTDFTLLPDSRSFKVGVSYLVEVFSNKRTLL